MPKPRVQILVCTNERPPGADKPSCAQRGAVEVYRRFQDQVKALGLREEVMVVRTGCLKHCSRGTTCTIWPHNLWYKRVTPADVDEILEKSVVGEGQVVERLLMPDIPWE
ncbi:MAG TPA: (2Fe-2S) ferredoxin domain-containing protein [Thermoanaerobaculia bacterium]|nr:(2Fe-2S) ferredoxin domain-containing protein [Thermoanaerobaculia bacterium]